MTSKDIQISSIQYSVNNYSLHDVHCFSTYSSYVTLYIWQFPQLPHISTPDNYYSTVLLCIQLFKDSMYKWDDATFSISVSGLFHWE